MIKYINFLLSLFKLKLEPLVKHDTWEALRLIDKPDIIIDIGIAMGTPKLYKIFPKQKYILVDPLIECLKFIRLNYNYLNYEFFEYGIGQKKEILEINVEKNIARSSLLKRTALSNKGKILSKRKVNIITASELALKAKIDFKKSIGVKIDTEGYELEIVKSFLESKLNIRWFICEVSVLKRFEASYNCNELIEILSQYGYKIRYILNSSADKDGFVRLIDVIFEKESAQ